MVACGVRYLRRSRASCPVRHTHTWVAVVICGASWCARGCVGRQTQLRPSRRLSHRRPACGFGVHNGTPGEWFGGAHMHTPHDCSALFTAHPLFPFSLRAAAALYLRGRSRRGGGTSASLGPCALRTAQPGAPGMGVRLMGTCDVSEHRSLWTAEPDRPPFVHLCLTNCEHHLWGSGTGASERARAPHARHPQHAQHAQHAASHRSRARCCAARTGVVSFSHWPSPSHPLQGDDGVLSQDSDPFQLNVNSA